MVCLLDEVLKDSTENRSGTRYQPIGWRACRKTPLSLSPRYMGMHFPIPISENLLLPEASPAAGNGAVDKIKNDFELYIKIMCHQNMASTQGVDANAVLKQYGLTAADWGMIGCHWAPQMGSNLELAMKMSPLMEKYNTEFATAKAGDDISF